MAVDIARLAIQVVGSGAAGGGQRLAWEASEMVGMFATGALLLGGAIAQEMAPDANLRALGSSAFQSGATVVGWVGAEKVLLGDNSAMAHKLRANQARRRALSRSPNTPVYSSDGVPHASLHGLNEQTGEEIRASAI